ncbi:N-acetylmuramoyl-L-alanine amidase [Sinorhizobium medicae]|nr:N-acetylmuramoyl-L-alanine amidase [Sinorhizobium medicae]MDX1066536.1 N-acetylmuramoyl-L-alanine amidase [Sinorhizobium medicae]MDX2330264.1 N-acetylmuramoyl-L-alanine amidase [Sinorhizobium medicae]
MRPIDTIVVHCTASPEGKDHSIDTIRGWHKGVGWSDIGYHFIVHLGGKVSVGRPIEKVGAHVAGHNATSIGVSYVGGVAADGKTPKDTRTAAQKSALRKLVAEASRRGPSCCRRSARAPAGWPCRQREDVAAGRS